MIKLIKETEAYKNIEFEINSFQNLFKTGKKLPTQFRESIKNAFDGISENQFVDLRSYELKKLKLFKEENIFYEYFKKYESFQSMNLEEKIDITIGDFIDCSIKTGNFTAQKRRHFLNDFSEFLEVKFFKSVNGNEIIEENENHTPVLTCFNSSLKLIEIVVDEKKFKLINFNTLKNFDIIYKCNVKNLELNDRFKSDLIILLILLEKNEVIKLPSQKYISQISEEIIKNAISTTFISKVYAKNSDPKIRTPEDDKVFKNISEFLDQFIS